ncbi:MAG TPA: HAD hydrolase family protein [Gemmatimonadaceae bacterium]
MRTPRSSVSAAPLVVCFSDVDGTLMDERERLIIDRDDAAGFASFMELVLTSSRTLVELARIQRRLGLVAPLIGENGAVVGLPPRWRGGRSPGLRRVGGRSMQVIPLGQPAVTVRSRTRRCARAASVRIVEQRDLLPDRGRSLRRTHSVCVRNWRGPAAERFLAALRDEGLDATRSGRWITITAGADKGGGAREVLAMAVRRGAQFQWSAAIGNAENDAPLLAAADRRYAIRNPRRGHDPALVRVPRVHALTLVGLAGWREALGRILAQRRSQ